MLREKSNDALLKPTADAALAVDEADMSTVGRNFEKEAWASFRLDVWKTRCGKKRIVTRVEQQRWDGDPSQELRGAGASPIVSRVAETVQRRGKTFVKFRDRAHTARGDRAELLRKVQHLSLIHI